MQRDYTVLALVIRIAFFIILAFLFAKIVPGVLIGEFNHIAGLVN